MSTKIYTGIKINSTDIWDIEKQIRETMNKTFDQKNRELTENYIKDAYAKSIAEFIQQGTELPTVAKLMTQALLLYRDDKHEPDYIDTLQARVKIYPPLEGVEGLLGFVENKEYFSDLLKSPLIEDYSYWDNTDRPEEVSEEEWDERRENWNLILDRSDLLLTRTGIQIDLGRELEGFNLDSKALLEAPLWNSEYTLREVRQMNFYITNRISASKYAKKVLEENKQVSNESLDDDLTGKVLVAVHWLKDKVEGIDKEEGFPFSKFPSLPEGADSTTELSLPQINQELLDEWVGKSSEILKGD